MESRKLILGVVVLNLLFAAACHKPPKVSGQHAKKFQAIVMVAEPKDLKLYQSLLIKGKNVEMPEMPLVGIYAAYFPIPGVAFAEGGVVLRVRYKGKEAWTLVSNCVEKSETLIYYSARMTGFPKFKADQVSLMPTLPGWEARVTAKAKTWLLLQFTAQVISDQHPDWQENFLSGKKYQLQDGLVLQIPPRKGPYTYKYDLSTLAASEGRKLEKGLVKVVTDSQEPWVGLITPGASYPALFLIDE